MGRSRSDAGKARCRDSSDAASSAQGQAVAGGGQDKGLERRRGSRGTGLVKRRRTMMKGLGG